MGKGVVWAFTGWFLLAFSRNRRCLPQGEECREPEERHEGEPSSSSCLPPDSSLSSPPSPPLALTPPLAPPSPDHLAAGRPCKELSEEGLGGQQGWWCDSWQPTLHSRPSTRASRGGGSFALASLSAMSSSTVGRACDDGQMGDSVWGWVEGW